MNLYANILTSGLGPVFYLILVAIGPLIFFAWLIHVFEGLMQRRLARRFGWNAVMLTGWLGTPVHELSHALLCAIFRHDIVEMELFRPDRRNGRLGYVTHTWQRGNLYQEVGSFFIGIAPLIGGTAALVILLMIFFPDVGRASMTQTSADLPIWSQVGASLRELFSGLFHVRHLASFHLWLFLYLVVCVGSHMAPSASDYEGAGKGALLLLLLLVLAGVVVALVNPSTSTLTTVMKPFFVPVITILLAVIALCGTATLVVVLLTELLDRL